MPGVTANSNRISGSEGVAYLFYFIFLWEQNLMVAIFLIDLPKKKPYLLKRT